MKKQIRESDKCTCGSNPDPCWTEEDFRRKEKAVKNCSVHKGENNRGKDERFAKKVLVDPWDEGIEKLEENRWYLTSDQVTLHKKINEIIDYVNAIEKIINRTEEKAIQYCECKKPYKCCGCADGKIHCVICGKKIKQVD